MWLGTTIEEVPKLIPGLLLAILIVVVAIWLAEFIGTTLMGFAKSPVSDIMMAVLIGLLVRNTVGLLDIFRPGIEFCVKKLLRLGIMMMGIRLSIFSVAEIGAAGVPVVIMCIAAGLVVTSYINKLLKLPERLGTLIAVGTGICGASAIVATAPGIDATDEEVTYAVANITVFGIVAMFLYPYIANLIFSGNQIMSGLFLGTSVHETAQVTGAGLIYDAQFLPSKPTAADVAIVTKLVRNVFMAIVIPLMTFVYARQMAGREGFEGKKVSAAKLFPLFILGFIFMAVLRSIGDAGVQAGGNAFGILDGNAWEMIYKGITHWAGNFLAVAMAGVGLGANLEVMRGLGVKPFYVGLLSALLVGVVGVICAFIFSPFIMF
jgi:uncharacterized integral membrane protein (TIGR00698 family)